MKHIKAKILWMHDEDDLVTPLHDALKVKEENFPNVQFIITKGLGHSRIYRDAEVGRTIVDFL
jgi:pimeloyl-ACP methyl ester carboxylesterase